MTDSEFDVQAAAIAAEALALGDQGKLAPHERFAAACRGSANPAALSWLAESLGLRVESTVVDLGSGLGGPAGWLAARYGCLVVAIEPAPHAAAASAELFRLPVINATSSAVPLRTDSCDAALLLGVVSVVDDATDLLAEARRVAHRLGVLDYCSTTPRAVLAGGSRFPSRADLLDMIEAAGWVVDDTSAMPVAAPQSWTKAAEKITVPANQNETEVASAIEDGSIAPFILIGSR